MRHISLKSFNSNDLIRVLWIDISNFRTFFHPSSFFLCFYVPDAWQVWRRRSARRLFAATPSVSLDSSMTPSNHFQMRYTHQEISSRSTRTIHLVLIISLATQTVTRYHLTDEFLALSISLLYKLLLRYRIIQKILGKKSCKDKISKIPIKYSVLSNSFKHSDDYSYYYYLFHFSFFTNICH